MLRVLSKLLRGAARNPRNIYPFLKRKAVDYFRTHRLWRRKRYDGAYTYDVISACYNVAPYLDDYFRSLTEQILDFERHIRLILVDDGSTDDTAAIIDSWKQRYPKNIISIRQENKGQAAARNAGLEPAVAPWVTFIDPDDFVDVTYFARTDNFLREWPDMEPGQELVMIGCNMIVYIESRKLFQDSHPLRFKFAKPQTILDVNSLGDNIQLSASSAFFPLARLKETRAHFEEKIRGVFEDGHFILSYFNECDAGSVVYLKSARYYYRRRGDASSSVRSARRDTYYYFDNMVDGYLDAITTSSRKFGHVPPHVQRAVCYDLFWRVRDGYMRSELPALNREETREYFTLLNAVSAHIDPDIITGFPYGVHRLRPGALTGILHTFKGLLPSLPVVYVRRFDQQRQRLCLYFFSGASCQPDISVNGRSVSPARKADSIIPFAGIPFVIRTTLWISLADDEEGLLSVRLHGKEAVLEGPRGRTEGPVSIPALIKAARG